MPPSEQEPDSDKPGFPARSTQHLAALLGACKSKPQASRPVKPGSSTAGGGYGPRAPGGEHPPDSYEARGHAPADHLHRTCRGSPTTERLPGGRGGAEAASGFVCGSRGTPALCTCSRAAQSCGGLSLSHSSAFGASSARQEQEAKGITSADGTSWSPLPAAHHCQVAGPMSCLAGLPGPPGNGVDSLPLGGSGPTGAGKQQQKQQEKSSFSRGGPEEAPEGRNQGPAEEEASPSLETRPWRACSPGERELARLAWGGGGRAHRDPAHGGDVRPSDKQTHGFPRLCSYRVCLDHTFAPAFPWSPGTPAAGPPCAISGPSRGLRSVSAGLPLPGLVWTLVGKKQAAGGEQDRHPGRRLGTEPVSFYACGVIATAHVDGKLRPTGSKSPPIAQKEGARGVSSALDGTGPTVLGLEQSGPRDAQRVVDMRRGRGCAQQGQS
ncbi:collagen alpha-1(I) chain-like [Panthera leo]|uniref:collagen alpha-1(I) chain-like n=1 Tax=Panthera leo TaxID=9689 RepID=UPI001C6A2F65|nr:collagen alpha-1(I) chain-like [Panthera leo]